MSLLDSTLVLRVTVTFLEPHISVVSVQQKPICSSRSPVLFSSCHLKFSSCKKIFSFRFNEKKSLMVNLSVKQQCPTAST